MVKSLIAKKLKVEIITIAAFIFILVYTLMLRPVIGVADNGDFPRIMGSTGLQYLTNDYNERYFGYVNREYGIGIPTLIGGGYFSSELFVVISAELLSQSLLKTGIFDIRYLSFIYSIVFLTAMYFIIRFNRKRLGIAGWLLAALLVLILADIGYISYFNSLYGEAVSFVFLLLMTGAGIYLATVEKPQLWGLILFFIGAFFFAGAKVQNAPVGLLAALLGLRLLKLRNDIVWKRVTVISAAAVIGISFLTYITISKDIKVCNKYQTVFFGILKDSPNPAGDLEELGLSPDLSVLAGTNYFMKNYPVNIRTEAFKKDLYKKVSHIKIAAFYLKHPERFIQKLGVAAENAFKVKQGFGNYEKYPGIKYKTTANIFGLWSDFKMNVLPHKLWFILILYASYMFVLIIKYIRKKDVKSRLFIELIAIICLIGAMQLVIPIIGDGEADLSKHLFLFNVSFDMMFITGAVYSVCFVKGIYRNIFYKAC